MTLICCCRCQVCLLHVSKLVLIFRSCIASLFNHFWFLFHDVLSFWQGWSSFSSRVCLSCQDLMIWFEMNPRIQIQISRYTIKLHYYTVIKKTCKIDINKYATHPSIFFHLPVAGLRGQESKRRTPDLPLPLHLLPLAQGARWPLES